jgi:DNA-binding transcriptional ArsR family regulator
MADVGEDPEKGEAGQGKGEPGKQKKKAQLSEEMHTLRAARREEGPSGPKRRTKVLWVIAHPVRRQILGAIKDYGESCTPHEIATDLNLSLAIVLYHATVLRKVGAVELPDQT